MASTLYTDIKKWKDGKPGSLFCRPREGLFGLREWTKDKELSHLVEDADEFFGAGLVARPFSPQDSHSSGRHGVRPRIDRTRREATTQVSPRRRRKRR